MPLNFNIGLLGHVDSGKTSLALALSTCASTAAFDKSPQSQEREITLDLGFSSFITKMPAHLRPIVGADKDEELQLTFVDCPGHSSLIRTIISGAQIIDLIILVVDAQKGIQTQTAECIVIGEILRRKLIVVFNKIDLFEKASRDKKLQQLHTRMRKTLSKTSFGSDVEFFDVSTRCDSDMKAFREHLCNLTFLPQRHDTFPLVIYVDHCFGIRGQGTICTGTVMQGNVAVNDTIALPALGVERRVKSIQIFRRSTQAASAGDRIGVCLTKFNSKLLERGLLAQPRYLERVYAICIRLQRIPYYKGIIKSGGKFHYTLAHKTVTGKLTLFKENTDNGNDIIDESDENARNFDPKAKEYEFVEALNNIDESSSSSMNDIYYALIEFDVALFIVPNAVVIASNLAMDGQRNLCRLAFWGETLWSTRSSDFHCNEFSQWKLFKWKFKKGTIAHLIDEHYCIVDHLVSKTSNRDLYVGMHVQLVASNEVGIIERTFGQSKKVRVYFPVALKEETIHQLRTWGGRCSERNVNAGIGINIVELRLKKYICSKDVVYKQ